MYLTQMAEIPLLTREQEIALAKKIEVTRKRFRRTVLGCDFAMRATIETLEKVHEGILPFDRTIKVSLTEQLTKEQIMARMPHNLPTLDRLLAREPQGLPPGDAQARRARGAAGRPRPLPPSPPACLTLVEELSLRHAPRAAADAPAGGALRPHGDARRTHCPLWRATPAAKDERANLRKELRDLMLLTLETPKSLRSRCQKMRQPVHRLRAGQARALQRQPAAGGLDRQEVPQPRPELPGPDPGRATPA